MPMIVGSVIVSVAMIMTGRFLGMKMTVHMQVTVGVDVGMNMLVGMQRISVNVF